MPLDLQLTDPSIVVVDRSGERLPYSRGIMATSLLATGVSTEEAYRLASSIQAELHRDSGRELPAEELVEITEAILRSREGGDAIAERWMAWRTAKRTGRPLVIALGGAPGVGKSTFATRLAVRLGITRIVTTDAIREVLRTVVPAAVLSELHASTFELTDAPGRDGFASFDRQCDVVTSAMTSVAQRLAAEHRSMIAEGVHLVPGALTTALADHPAAPIVVERLAIAPAGTHAANLRQRATSEPLRGGERHVGSFDRIRAISDHLVDTAAETGTGVVDVGLAGEMTQDIVDEIVARAAASPPVAPASGTDPSRPEAA
ncbi:MAG: hypothetical protein QNJ12_10040 [Ilumatobacter sp.]|uniref:ATP cone domain-containing protein n=1 Tax=Ilumatobacter sp. TaxID=1967498 RepID=UPI00260963E6|nr:ATP cone domain-containing protein [Ilumatobacter sp.]MDJ0769126.1 hypothetical protein [Ilumatobacter sp.]